MVSFSALEVLEANELHTSTMCQLTQLKELHLELTSNDINLGAMASNLNNFERLRIVGTVDQLSSFLRHSKKLKFVIFEDYTGDCNALDVSDLNRSHRTSGMKQKVQIGIRAYLYLETKRTEKQENNDLIEIIRVETMRQHFHFR